MKNNQASRQKRVIAQPMKMLWCRAWYCPDENRLSLTRLGHLTKHGVIRDAEAQFGESWRKLTTKGVNGATIKAVRCEVHLSPKDINFKST